MSYLKPAPIQERMAWASGLIEVHKILDDDPAHDLRVAIWPAAIRYIHERVNGTTYIAMSPGFEIAGHSSIQVRESYDEIARKLAPPLSLRLDSSRNPRIPDPNAKTFDGAV